MVGVAVRDTEHVVSVYFPGGMGPVLLDAFDAVAAQNRLLQAIATASPVGVRARRDMQEFNNGQCIRPRRLRGAIILGAGTADTGFASFVMSDDDARGIEWALMHAAREAAALNRAGDTRH